MAPQGCFKQDDPEYAVPLRDVAYDGRSRNMAKPLPDRGRAEPALPGRSGALEGRSA